MAFCKIFQPADHGFFELFIWFKCGKEAQRKPTMSQDVIVQRLFQSFEKSMSDFWTVILP
jgi:hypothetical protein